MFKYAKAFGSASLVATLMLCTYGSVAATPPGYPDTRTALQRLTEADGAPGALLEVRDAHGRTVLTSGVANRDTHAPMTGDARFRIGSMTKIFVATVVLQLVGEGRLDLDAPVERYLPGVVRGDGYDGHDITVRQLLQHTSGLPDYVDFLDLTQITTSPATHHDPMELVRLALAQPRTFAPGTGWHYSNTGYLLAGMIIDKVTGHPYAEEIDSRIIRPLALTDTLVPGDDQEIPGTHSQGYLKSADSMVDITRFNPTVAGASGAMISTASDLNRFLDALVNGRLLRPAELQAMMTTRPTGDSDGSAYGLGLISTPLPCGGSYWNHDGGTPGFRSLGGATSDGRTATAMANLLAPGDDILAADLSAAVTTALCESAR
ncbi:serine hydrolase domain-containing protein [Nocardia concava]|uniref:serine hydrolase domain-containing protein n=1 Tax=Nocardia concava TaxID=257281 RepID=UPI00030640E3|nr:serine hydrolase domain-containing protein [Nocardia concava]